MVEETQDSLVDELRRITQTLLDPLRSASSLRTEVLQLRSIFERAGGFMTDADADIASGETITDGGVAISPAMAAMCLDDFTRTVQFLRGVFDAITELRHRITDRPVRVLYAGCGPFAPLVVPVMSVLPSEAAQFTLLDIHEQSIVSAERVVRHLGLGDRVQAFVVADATRYRIDHHSQPDLMIVEMMRAVLESEPQVAVTGHLLSEAPGAMIVPQEVKIDLVLVDPSREHSVNETAPARDRVPLRTVFYLGRDDLGSGSEGSVTVRIPDFDPNRYRLTLFTTVEVYGDHMLKDYDSGITCPKKLRMDGEIRSGDEIEFTYETGRRPKLVAKRVPSS
ncbi:MAG TPA: hypothetical protein VFZ23_02865 [Pyrinomonadaceae bacterium]